ncbi:phage head-tail connector protein [Aerococcus mictus]
MRYETIKLLKGIKDDKQDELITLLVDDSIERILAFINIHRIAKKTEIPDDLEFVVRDIASKRFNRLNAEGTTSTTEEGASFHWQENDLKEYHEILMSYSDKPDYKAKGIARFI